MWWTKYHKQHADFREWVLDGPEVADGVGSLLSKLAAVDNGCGRVLHIGCGSSTLHEDLLKAGFQSVVNIDFSEEVIARMRDRYSDREELSFVVADARNLDPPDFGGQESFDAVVGKGLFDCLLSHGSEEHKVLNCQLTLRSLHRLMKPHALLVETSMFEPSKRVPYLEADNLFAVEPISVELNPLELPHQKFSFIYILRPKKADISTNETAKTTDASPTVEGGTSELEAASNGLDVVTEVHDEV